MKLDIGCGYKPVPGYTTVDLRPEVGADYCFDISKDPWPFPDSSMEEVLASHVLEHLGPEPEKLFHCIREVYRVCAPGALFRVAVPHPRHDIFLHDPTHVRPITPGTLAMFSREVVDKHRTGSVFGITPLAYYLGVDFRMLDLNYRFDPRFPADTPLNVLLGYEKTQNNVVTEYLVTMKAIK